jgi:iron complex outermembrane receptor protein
MISRTDRFLLGVVAIAGSAQVYAQVGTEETDLALAYGDKETVSIATGNAQPLRRAPAVASVITAEEFAAMGAQNLDDVLESVPGLHVSRASVRYAPIYAIRGVAGGQSNPQVLMLQDGIPMTTMFNGDKGAAWIDVPLENIARVEVIRGPGSALYGADAYVGVINVITKSAADTPGTEIGGGAGSFDGWKAWAQHGGKLGPFDMAAYIRLGSTEGSKEIIEADAQTRNDISFGTLASLAPGPVNTGHDMIDASLDLGYENWRLRAGYKLRDNLETGAGINSALDPTSTGRAEDINLNASWRNEHVSQNWGLGITASYLHYNFTYPDYLMLLPAGAVLASGAFPNGLIGSPNQWERQFRFSGHATYAGFDDHGIRFGIGHDDLDLYKTRTYKNYLQNASGASIPTGPVIDYSDIQPFIRPQRRTVDYVYAQDEWGFAPDWTLTAGLRHDRYSDFGTTTNPRLALVWDANYALTAKLLYGEAFRAPSFNEQYGINAVLNGNPNLTPETIKTLEAAFSWQGRKDIQVNLSLFKYAMRDIIRLVPNIAPTPGSTYQNTGRQHGSGLEVEAIWDVSRNLRLSGNYAWQRSIDDATNRDAGYAPHHHLYVRADWGFSNRWSLGGQVNWVADRERTATDTRPQIDDYATFDLTLRGARVAGNWDVAVVAHNLFDADAREPSLAPGTIANDLPLPGRSVFLEFQYRTK